MASKPILFNTEMVRAILDGRKTQTRRLIKDKDITNNFDIDVDGSVYAYIDQATGDSYPPTAIAKYQVGDILWVRETWLKADDGYYYKADIEVPSESEDLRKAYGYKWKPSIHMPREAARLFLRVTNVRVERLQEITGQDVLKEGLNSHVHPQAFYFDCNQREMFENLWNSTIKKSGLDRYGWDANPWVWVIEFERIAA